MRIEHTEVVWLSARSDYSFDEVAQMSGLPAEMVEALARCGALPPGGTSDQGTTGFAADDIVLARAAGRLREHFELDEQGLALAVSLLRRVRMLEARLAALRASTIAPID